MVDDIKRGYSVFFAYIHIIPDSFNFPIFISTSFYYPFCNSFRFQSIPFVIAWKQNIVDDEIHQLRCECDAVDEWPREEFGANFKGLAWMKKNLFNDNINDYNEEKVQKIIIRGISNIFYSNFEFLSNLNAKQIISFFVLNVSEARKLWNKWKGRFFNLAWHSVILLLLLFPC